MTAHSMAGDRDKCLAAGMDDYLSKPIRPSLLEDALNRCTARPRPHTVLALAGPAEPD